jgi:hypothetical protein
MEKTPPVKIQPPPFQRRIEPDEIVAVGAVRRVEEFGEDQKREKQHGEESGEGPGEAGSLSVQSSRCEISQMRTALANSSSPHS